MAVKSYGLPCKRGLEGFCFLRITIGKINENSNRCKVLKKFMVFWIAMLMLQDVVTSKSFGGCEIRRYCC